MPTSLTGKTRAQSAIHPCRLQQPAHNNSGDRSVSVPTVDPAQLYSALRLRLLAYFNHRNGYAQADDLLHDLFVKYIAALDKNTNIAQPNHWLWRAAHNLAIDHYRRAAASHHHAPGLTHPATLEDFIATERTQDIDTRPQIHIHAANADALHTIMPQLTEDQLTFLRLRYVHDLTLQEIADLLDIAITAAKARHLRLLARLRKLLESPIYKDEG
ncbi:hypothetical protein LCGC14_0759760 [marine sediment metagenome]|uniref:RNA polymerase sigma-70 region 2 domain-containing protein n=1 Tax=marine sediment metagenome TaxID=412755 RepID=A0A0F9SLQ3_9ZZZZ